MFAVARRDINLGLKFDRNERLTLVIARLRIHANRKSVAGRDSRLSGARKASRPYGATISTYDADDPVKAENGMTALLAITTLSID